METKKKIPAIKKANELSQNGESKMDTTAGQKIVAAGIIAKAVETLQIANMRLANNEYLVVSVELMETARSLKTVARQLRELHDLTE
ncbi:hypothetical protein Q3P76_003128 [Salmonella enterica]|nr:hypothetical protein [Salmonella enterica]EAR2960411.1 hypothetical protein [Salmonella enterica]EBC0165466.1 hypothetical protein [Salmonella enterica]EBO4370955.1 hypothetical protein [Salmonella enterica]EDY7006906.1 hypothetical protein [Salmonella enterica]